MAVVTTTFSSAAGDLWASPTWVSTDPSWKLDVQLTNWVNAINDASKISIIHDPGDATARGSTDLVRWLLRCRESDTSSDYGLSFGVNRADGATQSPAISGLRCYYARTAGASNNGAGTLSEISISNVQLLPQSMPSYAMDYRTAYDAEGASPWFAFIAEVQQGASRLATLNFICRLSTANMASGSYYPATGLGKWFAFATSASSASTITLPKFVTPQRSAAAPYIGVIAARDIRAPRPASSSGDGYFFKLGAQYGDSHFLGEPTYDMLISNGETGNFGDTVTVESKTYTRAAGALWVRIA